MKLTSDEIYQMYTDKLKWITNTGEDPKIPGLFLIRTSMGEYNLCKDSSTLHWEALSGIYIQRYGMILDKPELVLVEEDDDEIIDDESNEFNIETELVYAISRSTNGYTCISFYNKYDKSKTVVYNVKTSKNKHHEYIARFKQKPTLNVKKMYPFSK